MVRTDLDPPYTSAELAAISDPEQREKAEWQYGYWERRLLTKYGQEHMRDLFVARKVLEAIDLYNENFYPFRQHEMLDRSQWERPNTYANRLIGHLKYHEWEIDDEIRSPLSFSKNKTQSEIDADLAQYAAALSADFDQQWEVWGIVAA